jgi:phospholipid transport system substrate-binding protein
LNGLSQTIIAGFVTTLARRAAEVLRALRTPLIVLLERQMTQRSLLLSAFVLLSSVIGVPPRSVAATDDPERIVGDLGTRALEAMGNGDTAAVKGQLRQIFRQYFDTEACARSALGSHWQNVTPQQRQEYANRYEDYIVIVYSTFLAHFVGERFTVLGSQPNDEGVIVTSRINGVVSVGIDWQLKPTGSGYKVINVIADGINMARIQRSDLVSVVQRNGGHVQALLVALREKNASNGILRY